MEQDDKSIFFRWGTQVSSRPRLFLLICLVFILGLAVFLPETTFDTTTEGFLPEDDQVIERYEAFRDEFGRDDYIVLAIRDPDIFSERFVTSLRSLHETLELDVPWVDQVDSLINARRITGENDDLIVEDFLEESDEEEGEGYFRNKQQQAMENPLYQRLLIDEALEYTTVVLRMRNAAMIDGELVKLTDQDMEQALVKVRSVVDQWQARNTESDVLLAGSPVIVKRLKDAMIQDMRQFTFLTIGIISLFLLLLFRRLSGVLMPLMVVLLSVMSTVAAMALASAPIQLPTVILPSFILAVAVGDSVHFLTLFYRHFDDHPDVQDLKEKSEAIAKAMAHTGTPMLLTSLTTAAGLASFSFAGIVPIANLGIFAALGVAIAFLLTVIMLPALLMLFPVKRKKLEKPEVHNMAGWFDLALELFTNRCIALSAHFPKSVIIVYLALACLALFSASKLHFSHDPVVWLPDHWEIKQATRITDEKLRGTVSIEILLDTGKADGVKDPAFLKRLDQVNRKMANLENRDVEVRKVISIVDIIKESNKALHGNQDLYYSIPDDQALVAQELFLLELSGADDLEDLVDSNYQVARVTISIPWIDTIYYRELLATIVEEYEQALGNRAEVHYTGLVPILGNTLKAVISSAAYSYLIAFVVISLLLVLMLRSFRYGLLAMIPNLVPITFTLGLMQVFSAPLDMFTMLIASIALGLSVDDTIHFMHHFKKRINQGKSVHLAISETLHTSGRAMLITSIVLCCGFIVYTFSEMNNLDTFGAYTAITIALALLADFLLAPALMIVSHRKTLN